MSFYLVFVWSNRLDLFAVAQDMNNHPMPISATPLFHHPLFHHPAPPPAAAMRRVLTQEQQSLFPLRSVADVVRLFSLELDKKRPSVALLSVVAGAVEHSLTAHRPDAETQDGADE